MTQKIAPKRNNGSTITHCEKIMLPTVPSLWHSMLECRETLSGKNPPGTTFKDRNIALQWFLTTRWILVGHSRWVKSAVKKLPGSPAHVTATASQVVPGVL
jgi:hypothetical protein